MPLLNLEKMTAGLSKTWSGFLRDWDRSLRAGNYPETTRYNYLLAAAQLARFLGEYSKALQQFFKWLMLEEDEIDRLPMERVRQPKTPQKLILVIPDDETSNAPWPPRAAPARLSSTVTWSRSPATSPRCPCAGRRRENCS